MSRLVAVIVLLACSSASADAGRSAVASSPSADAERALEEIRTSAEGNDDTRTEELARRFLLRFARDPLAARVELELARLYLLHAMPVPGAARSTTDSAGLDRSVSFLDRAAAHADPPTALRVSLYRGVVAYLRGDDATAVATLEPIGGSIVDVDDRRLELTTLNEACRSIGRLDCVLDTLDALRTGCRDPLECADVDARIAELDQADVDAPAAVRWVVSSDPTRPSWPSLASRVMRVAESRGDFATIRTIVERAATAGVTLDPEGRAIAERAQRGSVADPHVIGVIAGLTGSDPASSLAVVQAIARAAGVPPSDRIDSGSYRFVVRDHRGRPDEAARAIVDLVVSSRAIAIIGPTDVASAEVAAARAESMGVPYLSLAPVTPGRFVVDATRDRTDSSALAEATRRFGAELGVLEPRTAHEDDPSRARHFTHAGGRIDRATGARLRSATLRALYVDARPREIRRLVAAIVPLLARPRGDHVVLVLTRGVYDALPSRTRGLEGAVVLESESPGSHLPSAEIARAAFARIEAARASSREELADRLSALAPSPTERAQAFIVRQGRLVATP